MPRSLDEWLAFQTSVHPQTIDLGLDRLRLVLDTLGWRQPAVPVITVAGTNGKGSTSATLASIAKAAGLRTALYTSPHLLRVNERIRVANEDELQEISDEDFARTGTRN